MFAYYTLTNNSKKLAVRLGQLFNKQVASIQEYKGGNYILVTPTLGSGDMPLKVKYFLEEHGEACIGTITSGNRNWGQYFAGAGDHIKEVFNIDNLKKVEQKGQEVTDAEWKELLGGYIEKL